MWNVKTKVVPAITEATGNNLKAFRKYLSNVPGKHYRNHPYLALHRHCGKC